MSANIDDKQAEQAIINFVKSHVSRATAPKVEEELKKDFVLGKRKPKTTKQKAKKKKIKNLTGKEKRKLQFYSFPRNSVKYSDFLPMHEVWLGYMDSVLETDKFTPDNPKGWENFTQSVYRSDFHGSMLEVVRSKCPSYVGKRGICIMDTKNTFKIVSKENLVTTIPKKECVFDIFLNKLKITIFGKHFCARPAERSNKKVKSHGIPDLLQ